MNSDKNIHFFYVITWWLLSTSIFLFTYFAATNQLVLKVIIPLLLIAVILKEKALRFDRGLELYMLMFLWACLSVFYTVNIDMTLEYLRMLLGNIIIWYIASRCIKKVTDMKVLSYPLLLAVLVQLYFALSTKIQVAINPTNRGFERISGLSKNSNDEGRLLVFGIVIVLLSLNYMKSKTVKIIGIILIGCFYIAIFRTGSRSSLIAGTLVMITYVFLWSKKKNYALLISTLIAFFLLYYFSYDYIIHNTVMGRRLELATEHGEQNIRILLIKEGWQFFISHPIFGLGLGSFTSYSTGHYYSHNDYIEILASLGLPAFILYINIFLEYWRKGRKLFMDGNGYYKGTIIIAMAFIVGYLAFGIWDPSFYFPTTTLMLAFFYSLIIKMYYQYRIIKKSTIELPKENWKKVKMTM